ncbi:MAG: ectoine hydroxylase [Porticoccaceae bacterium]|nr:MAG: ectoine hydroxylase [Porticoccaceae bacterium]
MLQSPDLYPTRTGGPERILPRREPVVWEGLAPPQPWRLSPDQVASYAERGYLVFPGLLEDLVEPLWREIERLARTLGTRPERIAEPDSDELRTLFDPDRFSDLIDAVSRDPRILHPVRQLLGSEVHLMQSRVNVKPALVGKAFPWHSDFETWHCEDGLPAMRTLTAWIMLTENHAFNGPLYVLPGSHRLFVSCGGRTRPDNQKTSLRRQELGVPSPTVMGELLERFPLDAVQGPPGTLVFHECNLLHGSPDNLSGDPRTLLMFVYNSVENRPGAPYSGLPPRPPFLCRRQDPALEPLVAPVRP